MPITYKRVGNSALFSAFLVSYKYKRRKTSNIFRLFIFSTSACYIHDAVVPIKNTRYLFTFPFQVSTYIQRGVYEKQFSTQSFASTRSPHRQRKFLICPVITQQNIFHKLKSPIFFVPFYTRSAYAREICPEIIVPARLVCWEVAAPL